MPSFFLGLAAGFITSIGVGPITIAVVSRSLRNGMGAGLAVAGGAAIMDFLVIILISLGLGAVVSLGVMGTVLGLLCGIIFAFGGIWRLANPREISFLDSVTHTSHRSKERGFITHGATGALLYGANPLFVVVWAGIIAVLQNKGLIPVQLPFRVVFAFGAAIGTFGLFWILLTGVHKLALRFSLLHRASTIVPFIDIAVGIIILVEVFLKTTPH